MRALAPTFPDLLANARIGPGTVKLKLKQSRGNVQGEVVLPTTLGAFKLKTHLVQFEAPVGRMRRAFLPKRVLFVEVHRHEFAGNVNLWRSTSNESIPLTVVTTGRLMA